jgi:predicted ester cyclase
MLTRRGMLCGAAGTGLLLAGGTRIAAAQGAQQASQLERNKAVVRGFKEAQKLGKSVKEVEAEFLTPNYRRHRGGMLHLAANAQGQGFPGAGDYLRRAFPDRIDTGVEIIAEGDMVGYLFRLTGTHKGNLFGIEPTGKTINVYEVGIFKLIDGRISEAWFMADELALLRQIGATLPARKDGKRIVPPVTGEGEDADVVVKRLMAGPLDTVEARNRLLVARSKSSTPPKDVRAADFKQLRNGFFNLREFGIRNGAAKETVALAMPERRDPIDGLLAEGDKVWMRFKLSAVHAKPLYGLPPTGRRVEAAEIGIARIVDGKWQDAWYFGDELGLLLQLGYADQVLAP